MIDVVSIFCKISQTVCEHTFVSSVQMRLDEPYDMRFCIEEHASVTPFQEIESALGVVRDYTILSFPGALLSEF